MQFPEVKTLRDNDIMAGRYGIERVSVAELNGRKRAREVAYEQYLDQMADKRAASKRAYERQRSARTAYQEDMLEKAKLQRELAKEQYAIKKAEVEREKCAVAADPDLSEWLTLKGSESMAQAIARKKALAARVLRAPIKILSPRRVIQKSSYAAGAAKRKADALRRLAATRLRRQTQQMWSNKPGWVGRRNVLISALTGSMPSYEDKDFDFS